MAWLDWLQSIERDKVRQSGGYVHSDGGYSDVPEGTTMAPDGATAIAPFQPISKPADPTDAGVTVFGKAMDSVFGLDETEHKDRGRTPWPIAAGNTLKSGWDMAGHLLSPVDHDAKTGKTSLQVPGLVSDPANIMQGATDRGYSTPEEALALSGYALAGVSGARGLGVDLAPDSRPRAASGASSSPSTQSPFLGVFAGKSAKTADHQKLKQAEGLEQAQASAKDIWDQTGWYRGADGEWKFEISDAEMRFGDGVLAGRDIKALGREAGQGDAGARGPFRGRSEGRVLGQRGPAMGSDEQLSRRRGGPYESSEMAEAPQVGAALSQQLPTLGDLVVHPKLFEAYPGLQSTPFALARNPRGKSPDGRTDDASFTHPIKVDAPNSEIAGSTLLHEIQHKIQTAEGFEGGTSPFLAELPPEVLRDNPGLTSNLLSDNPAGLTSEGAQARYDNAMGEVEARNVQKRFEKNNYSDPPFVTEEKLKPREKQIAIGRKAGSSQAPFATTKKPDRSAFSNAADDKAAPLVSAAASQDQAPIRAYHYSPRAGEISEQNKFHPYSHFGTEDAAKERFRNTHGGGRRLEPDMSPGTLPVDLNISNPLRIIDTLDHNPLTVGNEVAATLGVGEKDFVQGVLRSRLDNLTPEQLMQSAEMRNYSYVYADKGLDPTSHEGAEAMRNHLQSSLMEEPRSIWRLRDQEREQNGGKLSAFRETQMRGDVRQSLYRGGNLFDASSPGQWSAINQILDGSGYDGLVYRNKIEDEGTDSYIATRPGTVKSATTGETLFSNGGNKPGLGALMFSEESVPSKASGHMKGTAGLPWQARQELTEGNLPSGSRDPVLGALGLQPAPMRPGVGSYTPEGASGPEVNPTRAQDVQGPFQQNAPEQGTRDALDFASLLKAATGVQDSVPAGWPSGDGSYLSSHSFKTDAPFRPSQGEAIANAAGDAGAWGWIDDGSGGARLFGKRGDYDPDAFARALTENGQPVQATGSSGFDSNFTATNLQDDWARQNKGEGRVTERVVTAYEKLPSDIKERLNGSPEIKQRFLDMISRDEAFAKTHGTSKPRDDVQTLRRILGEFGFEGLAGAHRSGRFYLPANAASGPLIPAGDENTQP